MILTLAFSLISCGGKNNREIPVQSPSTEQTQLAHEDDEGQNTMPGEVAEQSQGLSDVSDISGLMSSIMQNGWSADAVPSALPKYTEGKYDSSGGTADDFYILVNNTDQDALDRYLIELKSAGWIVSTDSNDGIAVLGIYEVVFDWKNSAATRLQINVRTESAGQWLYDDIPPDILPPKTGTLATAMTLEGSDEDGRYISFTIDGMDEAEAMEYLQMLVENGWSGEDAMVFKDFDWNGKSYNASVGIYEVVESRSTFTCDLWLAE